MKKVNIKNVSNIFVVLVALIVLCIALSIASPWFATQKNLINIVLQAAINATLACGMTFVILTGGIDLSVGSIVALAGIVLGIIVKAEIPLAAALLVCVLIGGFCGLVNGLLVTRLNLPAFIATLGTMSIARGAALYIAGGRSISGFSGKLNFIGSGAILGIPVMIIIMALTFIIGMESPPSSNRSGLVGQTKLRHIVVTHQHIIDAIFENSFFHIFIHSSPVVSVVTKFKVILLPVRLRLFSYRIPNSCISFPALTLSFLLNAFG